MANYKKVLLWIPNDTINIPQFPDYASGFNGGLGPNILDPSAKKLCSNKSEILNLIFELDIHIHYTTNNSQAHKNT